MRLLLLVMTGIGFTLGLLCGLLLHLPADGLPANANTNTNTNMNNNDDHDPSLYRSRRSFSDDEALVDASAHRNSQRWPAKLHPSPPLGLSAPGGGRAGWERGKPAFQSPPNPQLGSNPFVSSEAVAHLNGGPPAGPTADLNDPRLGGAEPTSGPRSVKGGAGREEEEEEEEGGEKNGGEGYYGNAPDSPSSSSAVVVNKPVKSFTLRLKNTGDKFVVDSAVRRHEEEDSAVLVPKPAPAVAEVAEEAAAAAAAGQADTEIQTAGQSDDTKNVDLSSSSSSRRATPVNKTSALEDLVSGVTWARRLDDSCPQGFEPREVASWRRKAVGMQVVGVEEGCGRMQNRRVTFKDGTQACARYRLNTDQIQGEVYSYYLARLLNITNLAPAVLLPVDTLSPQWRSVHLEMSMAQWADGRLVVLTRWLRDLAPSYIPHELREDDRKLHPTVGILGRKTVPELCDLLQWSDLIVFDYLTANLDRLVNNMFNRQWNAEMMSNPAHNLERTKGGSLVFLDNESGLFHGYRLLEKYHGYHESLLNSLCVFRASTAKAVKVLHKSKSVGEELHKLFSEGEIHHRHLPSIPEKNVSVLKDRLAKVYDQILTCEALYTR